MRCEVAQDLLIQRQLGELDPALEGDLSTHVSSCAACQRMAAVDMATDRHLARLQTLPPLPSQADAIRSRLPSGRRRMSAARVVKGAVGIAVAAAAFALALRFFPATDPTERPSKGAVEPLPPVTDPSSSLGTPRQDGVLLPSGFLEQIKPGSGWVATAPVPTPDGTAIAYYYVEPAPGDHFQASILLKHPDGRLTREINLGSVSVGRLPFTQPEFRLLRVGQHMLLAIATDDETGAGQGMGRLQIAAYHPQNHRLSLIPFDRGETLLPISTWPITTPVGIRTQTGRRAAEWHLTEHWTFLRLADFEAAVVPPPVGAILAQASLDTPGGSVSVKLRGTVADGTSIYLYRPDGTQVQEIDLGKPHFGGLTVTQPALHKVHLGERELLVLLSDPMISLPQQAVLRVFAYDPDRRQLRQIPFSNGEVLVDEVPVAEGNLLRTRQRGAGGVEWRLTDHWLLERVQ